MPAPDFTILVVDENAIRASTIVEGLREAGHHRVTVIHNIEAVARMIDTHPPDVVLIGIDNAVRDRMERHRRREAEMTALYETASDLTAIRDVDTILAAIVRRARQLLGADMAYLSLNDEAEGASYMKVTDGALTAEFRSLRLPLGTGLLGLVAQTGAPYFTEDYQADERFVHRDYIDTAVAGEQIRAILGVPLSSRAS